MILRFQSITFPVKKAACVAFNTETRTYTTNREIVHAFPPLSLPANDFDRLMQELDFNCYDYSDDLYHPIDHGEIPSF